MFKDLSLRCLNSSPTQQNNNNSNNFYSEIDRIILGIFNVWHGRIEVKLSNQLD